MDSLFETAKKTENKTKRNVFQSFNQKIGAWFKYKKSKSGETKILDVKERNDNKRFVNVPVKTK